MGRGRRTWVTPWPRSPIPWSGLRPNLGRVCARSGLRVKQPWSGLYGGLDGINLGRAYGASSYDSDERGGGGLRTLLVERRVGTACSPERTTRSMTCSWALRLGSSPSTTSRV